ncbi:winged helix-turn-helix domain-containing protein [Sandaracinobacter sp. RS1-74]|uniref:winged helix-turn-helix domain-containing protein n=1 Tax=Sandaracinobacteroides sayramensis TaxID=2913411 RepID=UPI001EDC8B97|nr:winged helix-turn-helix domain-containing protein [Sandaracinobacteroides sayramensis]MCG2841592.1 winged helix-turn-helix domain-containing protein [Sandaracinobacteroides sayramensis]
MSSKNEEKAAGDYFKHEMLRIMKDGNIYSTSKLEAELKKNLELTNYDKGKNEKRPNESRWRIRINNNLRPSEKSSLCGRGYVEKIDYDQYRITNKGLEYIEKINEEHEELKNDFQELGIHL